MVKEMDINRREFIKLSSTLPLNGLPVHFAAPRSPQAGEGLPNVLILVFDAFSAKNASLYGYPRLTTPLLEKLAERAMVFHNHYTGGSYTTPGTATLLTGTLPWTHRAVNPGDELSKTVKDRNIYHLLSDSYYRFGYSHNYFVDDLILKFMADVDQYIPRQELLLGIYWINSLFSKDFDTAMIAAQRAFENFQDRVNNTLYFPEIQRRLHNIKNRAILKKYGELFPLGIPESNGQEFLLEQSIDWLNENLAQLPQPFFGYFHLFPPHAPYNTRADFYNMHNDDYQPPVKPLPLINYDPHVSVRRLWRMRRQYDEFINYVDSEFDRLFRSLDDQGLLDNTWIILTSDHGEMFERGIEGHVGYTLHQPLVNVPLLIFPPGQQERVDIYMNTSAIDILPTVLSIAGRKPPEWSEGQVLMPLTSEQTEVQNRDIYCVQAKGSNPKLPLSRGTVMLIQGNYKLSYYFGYSLIEEGKELIEMYDLQQDPEELNDIYSPSMPLALSMRAQIIRRKRQEDQPYYKKP
jgi:arylsulfatase A-like enzyme